VLDLVTRESASGRVFVQQRTRADARLPGPPRTLRFAMIAVRTRFSGGTAGKKTRDSGRAASAAACEEPATRLHEGRAP
jgi:hypothetical protein